MVSLRRGPGDVPLLSARSTPELAVALGDAHATDRPWQMLVFRVMAQGRTAELAGGRPELLSLDHTVRRMGLVQGAARDVAASSGTESALIESYAAGVNRRWRQPFGVPFLAPLAGLRAEPWRPVDSFAVLRLLAWMGPGQIQELIERLLLGIELRGTVEDRRATAQAWRRSVSAGAWLRGGAADSLLAAEAPPVTLPPLDLDLQSPALGVAAGGSNAWAIGPSRTRSGRPILCNDPHMEVSRFPTTFYEAALHSPEGSGVFVTVPGIPALLAGRSRAVAVGVTFAFLDTSDLFVEEVRDGRVRRGDGFVPLERRVESIRVRGGNPEQLTVWEGALGVLQGDPTLPGRVLALCTSADRFGMQGGMLGSWGMLTARDTEGLMDLLRTGPLPLNYVVAGSDGVIGIQQAGRVPRRAPGHDGIRPEPGWRAERHWGGQADPTTLFREIHGPGEGPGFVATANNRLGSYSNAAMSEDRRDRIAQLLADLHDTTWERAASVQRDLGSLHARRWLRVLRPQLEAHGSPAAVALLKWDGVYGADRVAATRFERVRAAALADLWGPVVERAQVPPRLPLRPPRTGREDPADAARHWLESSPSFEQHCEWEDARLADDPALPGGRTREEVLTAAIRGVLDAAAPRWGLAQQVVRSWLPLEGQEADPTMGPLIRLFGGRKVELPGSTHTPCQGRVVRMAGRRMGVGPVWRMATDLAETTVHTALWGGPGDRPLGRRSHLDFAMFQRGGWKHLPVGGDP